MARLGILLVVALSIAGLLLGAIGAALLGNDPFIRVPEVHLPPQEVFTVGGFSVTNTLLSAWLTTIVVVLLFGLGTRRMQLVPGRLQGAIEVLLGALDGFFQSVVGERYGRRFFPLLATIFIFVAFNAWMALLPIYPTVGLKEEGASLLWDPVKVHVLRSAGTDINMPMALAIISFFFVEGWGFRVHRFGYLKEFIRFRSPIEFFIGVLELLSHFIRLISFTFRLFGNMLAGEIVLVMVTFLLVFIAPVAFYMLEILVGGVQALIFMGLTLVFALMAVAPHGSEHEGAAVH